MKTHFLTRCLMPLSLSCAFILPLAAADWPQWRGPHRDGHSSETGLLQEWPKDGPKLLWQVTNCGSGFSTPSVVGDAIYLLGNEGMDNEFVEALSTKDGSRLWSTKLGKVGQPDQNPHYPGTRSTPTVDGKFLYALGSDGDLVCLEKADGKEHWRKNLRTDFDGKCGQWAYAESPLIDGDAVICTPGGSNATMIALNKLTGDVIWKCVTPEADDASYASAVVAELGGVKQYVQFFARGLAGIDAKTGKLLWRYQRTAGKSPAVVMTPLISDNYIYTGAFQAGGATIKVTRMDHAFVTQELYYNFSLPTPLGGAVKVGDYFYSSNDSAVMCVDFKTGEIKWKERSAGMAWLAADGRLYFHGQDGVVGLLEPSPEAYREKGHFTPPNGPPGGNQNPVLAYPVLADGHLYIRDQYSLWCYDVKAAK